MGAAVPSDHFTTSNANTRIRGSPFAWDGSFDDKNQQRPAKTGEPDAPIPRSASRENGTPVSAAPTVSGFYSNLQDAGELPNAASIIQGFANGGLGCGLKIASP